MKAFRTAAAVAVAGTVLASGSLALAAAGSGSASKGGKVKVFVTNTSQTKGKITITGAIGDYGTIVSTDKNGKVDPNGSFERAHLKQGGLVIDTTGLNKVFAHIHPQFNHANCSLSFAATGPVKIASGTGAYAGATGNAKVTVYFAGIAPKTKSGKCNTANNAPTFGSYNSVIGSGTISFQ